MSYQPEFRPYVKFTKDAIALQQSNAAQVTADFVRCSACHFLDRADFFCGRLAAGKPMCRKCQVGMTVYEPQFITDKEKKRITNGFYKQPDY